MQSGSTPTCVLAHVCSQLPASGGQQLLPLSEKITSGGRQPCCGHLYAAKGFQQDLTHLLKRPMISGRVS